MQDLLCIFKALSDETRLRLLKILEKGEICVCDLVSALNVSQPRISFHLNVLKEAGLIKDRKQGKWVHYSINDSDMFRRFLVVSVIEKVPDNTVRGNLSKMTKTIGIMNKSRCGQ